MLPLLQIATQDWIEVGIIDVALDETAQERSEPADRLGNQQTAWLQHSARLTQRCQAGRFWKSGGKAAP